MIELYIERQRVDLAPDTLIAQTFQALPIGDLSKRSSDFTNSFTIPGTANNQRIFELFGNPYMHSDKTGGAKSHHGLGVSRRWLRADISIGGLPLMRKGKVVLHYVTYDERGTPSYHIAVVAQGVQQLYDILKDRTLQDLELKEYDHHLDLATYINSQHNTEGYIYLHGQYTRGIIEPIHNPRNNPKEKNKYINTDGPIVSYTRDPDIPADSGYKINTSNLGGVVVQHQIPSFFVHTLLGKTFDLMERLGKIKIKDRRWLNDPRLKNELLPATSYLPPPLDELKEKVWVDAANVQPPISLYDFLTDAMKRCGIVGQDKSETLTFAYIKDLLAQRKNCQDWSPYFVRLKKLEPRLDNSYTRFNTMAFKEPSEEVSREDFPSEEKDLFYAGLEIAPEKTPPQALKATIRIDNHTLKEQPNEMFSSIFARYPRYTVRPANVTIKDKKVVTSHTEAWSMIYYPVLDPESKEPYQGSDYRLYCLSALKEPDLYYPSVKGKVVASISENLQLRFRLVPPNINDYRDAYYTEFGAMLHRQEKYTALFHLNAHSVHVADLLRPVWCRQMNGYFMLSKISQFIPGRLTEVELIRLPHADEVKKYRDRVAQQDRQ